MDFSHKGHDINIKSNAPAYIGKHSGSPESSFERFQLG